MSVDVIQDAMMSAFESQMGNVYTAMPCVVVAIRDSLQGQMVDIQPSLNQKFKDGSVQERPVILGVPVSFQVSKTAGFTFPINVGDTGTAIFSMRNMDTWKSGNGRPTSPANAAKMDKSDAIFFPGIQPPGVAVNNPGKHILTHNTQDTVIFGNLGGVEAEFRILADGSIKVTTSNMPIILEGSDVTINASSSINLNSPSMIVDVANTTWIGLISQTGDYAQVGTYTLNAVNVNLHVHTGVQPGNGTSGVMV